MLTLVVSVTDEEIFEKSLKRSLEKEKGKFKLIRTDPELSLSSSYNTVKKIKTPFIAFLHQDLIFKENGNWLIKAENFARKLGNFGALSFAGWKENGELITYIATYIPHKKWNKTVEYAGESLKGKIQGKPFEEPQEVQVNDDTFFLLRKEIWNKMKFDESFPFHMFAFDYCLTLKYKLGLKNYVIPLKTYEYAVTSWTPDYKKKHGRAKEWRKVLLKKWKNEIDWIQGFNTKTGRRRKKE